jgi:hypothetical protein
MTRLAFPAVRLHTLDDVQGRHSPSEGVVMAAFSFNEREKECVRILAKLFEEGRTFLHNPWEPLAAEGLEVDANSYPVLMDMMEECGAIGEPIHTSGGRFLAFKVLPAAVQVARAIVAKEKELAAPLDLVEQMKFTSRQKPLIAWPLMALLAIVFLATAVNQIAGALKALGWIP